MLWNNEAILVRRLQKIKEKKIAKDEKIEKDEKRDKCQKKNVRK